MSTGKQHDTRRRGFGWVVFAFVVIMLGTTLPTPLYPIYQQRLGLSELMITVIFATYAAGVIAALVTLGSWSDQLGRRPLMLAGITCSAASAVAFLVGGLAPLLAGRLLSGLSAGIFTGTASVAVIELAPPHLHGRATLVATAANMGGLGLGPAVAGVLARYVPLPLHACFALDLGLLALVAPGVWRAEETVRTAASPRLRPQRLSIPAPVRPVFLPAAIGGFAGFAVLGLFTAVAPAVLGSLLHRSDHALTGGVVCLVFAASTVGQLSLQRIRRRHAFPLGCLLLAIGAAVVGTAVGLASLWLLLAGAAVAGFGQGMGFRAGLLDITRCSPDTRRGEVASTYFVVLYVAISIPVVGIGIGADLIGLRMAAEAFAAGVAALACLAMALLVRRRARDAGDG